MPVEEMDATTSKPVARGVQPVRPVSTEAAGAGGSPILGAAEDTRTAEERAADKCVYWEAEVEWWTRWASEHNLKLDALNSTSVHLSFLRSLATEAAQDMETPVEPPTPQEAQLPPPSAGKSAHDGGS